MFRSLPTDLEQDLPVARVHRVSTLAAAELIATTERGEGLAELETAPEQPLQHGRDVRVAGWISDDFHLTPLTSYGAQKAASELLLADYHRREFLET
jgi:nucleoside-diphosphate-sugar epimerase